MVKFFEVKKVKISDIKLDSSNPNEVSDLKMQGLKEAVKNFGFLEPVVIDQDNLMIDGEHRLKILKEMGEKEIPVIKINVKDIDRKIIRQTMNKLRGVHDPRADINDLIQISKEVSLQDMSKYLGVEEKNLSDLLESIDQVPECFLSLMVEEKGNVKKRKFINFKLSDDQALKLIKEMGDFNLNEIALIPISGLLVNNIGKF